MNWNLKKWLRYEKNGTPLENERFSNLQRKHM